MNIDLPDLSQDPSATTATIGVAMVLLMALGHLGYTLTYKSLDQRDRPLALVLFDLALPFTVACFIAGVPHGLLAVAPLIVSSRRRGDAGEQPVAAVEPQESPP